MQLFPYVEVRPIQYEMMDTIEEAIASQKCAILDAPTGIGKTAAALTPALEHALKDELSVFFLTSRHTQHRLVVDTVRAISKKHSKKIGVADFIGKKHMCGQDGVDAFRAGEFLEYCKKLRENRQCAFYENFGSPGKPSPKAQLAVKQILSANPMHVEEITEFSKGQVLCPYETAGLLGSKSSLIICDYAMIFHPQMRQSIMNRTKKELSRSIIIVDEAHNLSSRLRDMMSSQTSTLAIKRALREAIKLEDDNLIDALNDLIKGLEEFSNQFEQESIIAKRELVELIDGDVEMLISQLQRGAEIVHETQQHSFLAGLAEFLAGWMREDEGFVRLVNKYRFKKELNVTIRFRCLDPGIWTVPVIQEARSTIMMSGTLHPTFMYKDIFNFPKDTVEKSYQSPFPRENRLCLVMPEVTTRYQRRSPKEFEKIAKICADISNKVPGNVAIYFPSYHLRDEVHRIFSPQSKKRFFIEMPNMTKKEKAAFIEEFKACYPKAVLLGVAGGNFSEGIDIEGNKLKAAIVVGLPLEHPNLETQALIKLYDKKYGRGWDYGYLLPAFNRAIQAAGRCIRSSTDKGAIILLDERYGWPKYKSNLPPYWDAKITRNYMSEIENFFDNKYGNFL